MIVIMGSAIKSYGQTAEETAAGDTLKCRQIVRTIINFGVNERQRLKLIELLAYELEDRNHLEQISSLVKRLNEGDDQASTLIVE